LCIPDLGDTCRCDPRRDQAVFCCRFDRLMARSPGAQRNTQTYDCHRETRRHQTAGRIDAAIHGLLLASDSPKAIVLLTGEKGAPAQLDLMRRGKAGRSDSIRGLPMHLDKLACILFTRVLTILRARCGLFERKFSSSAGHFETPPSELLRGKATARSPCPGGFVSRVRAACRHCDHRREDKCPNIMMASPLRP
jgi:hypothetical protein